MGKAIGSAQTRPVTERAAAWLHSLAEFDRDHHAGRRALALATRADMKAVWETLERHPGTVAEDFARLALLAELFIELTGPRAHPHEVAARIDRLNAKLKQVRADVAWLCAHLVDAEAVGQLGRLEGSLLGFPTIPLRPKAKPRQQQIMRFLSDALLDLTGTPHDVLVVTVADALGYPLGGKDPEARVKKDRQRRRPD